MKTGAISIKCPRCGGGNFAKKGKRKYKRNQQPLQVYQCKACKHRFTSNSLKPTYCQNKPELNKKVMELYCEGNTLRGMARIMGIQYNTVVAKFRHVAKLARERHLKALEQGEIQTAYMQFDGMETFVKTRKQPYGIELSIRPKTGQIISAKVCRVPIKGLTISKPLAVEWNLQSNREQGVCDMLLESSKALKEVATLASDGDRLSKSMVKQVLPERQHNTYTDYDRLWRMNHACAKLRHHISRLKRKTWAVTKSPERLQMHLDLFIAWNNGYRF